MFIDRKSLLSERSMNDARLGPNFQILDFLDVYLAVIQEHLKLIQALEVYELPSSQVIKSYQT